MTYLDESSTFEELLERDGSVTVHHRNLQFLAIEMFKSIKGIGPSFLKEIFNLNKNAFTENVSANTRLKATFYNPSNPKKVHSGTETIRYLSPKIWSMVPDQMREAASLPVFKEKIKKWIPVKCPCRLCKTNFRGVGFCNIDYSYV